MNTKGLLFLLVISIMLVACTDDDEITQNNTNLSDNVVNETIEEEVTIERNEKELTDEAGNSYSEINETGPSYSKSIRLPKVEDARVKREIKNELKSIESDFEAVIKEDGDEESTLTVEYTMTDTHALRIYNQTATMTGTTDDKKMFRTFLTHDGKHIKLKDFIDDSQVARELIGHYVYHELIRSVDAADYISKPSVERAIIKTDDAFDKAYIKDKELVFQFDTNEVADEGAGEPSVTVGFDTIGQLFTTEAKDLLSISDEDWVLHQAYAGYTRPTPYDKMYQLREVNVDKKLVSLTFDDGPMPGITEQLLEILDNHDVKATFYVVGRMVEAYPELAKRIVEEGHEIGNHSYNHPELVHLNANAIQYQLGHTQELIQTHTGTWAKTFRPPYGATNTFVRENAGLKEVLWNVDTNDWRTKNRHAILDAITGEVRDGAVVLMHDVVEETPFAVDELLNTLDNDEYEFVTISELYEVKDGDVSSFFDPPQQTDENIIEIEVLDEIEEE